MFATASFLLLQGSIINQEISWLVQVMRAVCYKFCVTCRCIAPLVFTSPFSRMFWRLEVSAVVQKPDLFHLGSGVVLASSQSPGRPPLALCGSRRPICIFTVICAPDIGLQESCAACCDEECSLESGVSSLSSCVACWLSVDQMKSVKLTDSRLPLGEALALLSQPRTLAQAALLALARLPCLWSLMYRMCLTLGPGTRGP